MSVCPPPCRKHTAFRLSPLARGLHAVLGMCNRFLFLSTLLAAVTVLTPGALAQGTQADAITEINGETQTSDVATVYFNAENCADAANTLYSLRLANGDGVAQVYMWAGVQNGNCNENDNRTDLQNLCRPMVMSNPRTVSDNATVIDLTLQELVDTGVVDCNNTALEGQPFEIYSFRNQDPGGNDVLPEGYGVAPFTVDVTPPDELIITSSLEQLGSTFTISWSTPIDSNSIAQYKLYGGATSDPSSATDTGVTAGQNAKSITVSASQLALATNASTYLFVSAIDMASVRIGNGNEGELSEATFVIAAETSGFCDDPTVDCSGCSVSPMMLANGQPGSGVWVIGLVFAIVCGRRLRR